MAQMLTPRRVPMRKCMGCAEHFPKMELIRVLRTPDGTIVLDATGKKSGRGAYICNNPACLKKAKKARRLETSLECEIPEEVFLRLEEELSGATGS